MTAKLPKPRLSRWGQSVYERPEQIAFEKTLFAEWVDVVPQYSDAEVVVVHSKQPIGDSELERLPSVKMVITTTSGFEHLDWRLMHTRGIVPVRMPLLRRDAVVESILAMLLHANRRQWQFQLDAKQNEWTRHRLTEYEPIRIQDQRVGVVGLGVIGTRLCEVLHFLGAEVYGVDPTGIPVGLPFVKAATFQELPTVVDATLLSCTHNASSHQMVNAEWLGQCNEMTLINCARGKLVDVEASLQALSGRKLDFLGVDVFPQEPYPDLSSVTKHGNVLCTPHAAGYHPALGTQIQTSLINIVSKWSKGDTIPFIVEERC